MLHLPSRLLSTSLQPVAAFNGRDRLVRVQPYIQSMRFISWEGGGFIPTGPHHSTGID